jgi:hypothetical protein
LEATSSRLRGLFLNHSPALFEELFDEPALELIGLRGWEPGFINPDVGVTLDGQTSTWRAGVDYNAAQIQGVGLWNPQGNWLVHSKWKYAPEVDGVDPWYTVAGNVTTGAQCFMGVSGQSNTNLITVIIRNTDADEQFISNIPITPGTFVDFLFLKNDGLLSAWVAGSKIFEMSAGTLTADLGKYFMLYQQGTAPAPGGIVWRCNHMALVQLPETA